MTLSGLQMACFLLQNTPLRASYSSVNCVPRITINCSIQDQQSELLTEQHSFSPILCRSYLSYPGSGSTIKQSIITTRNIYLFTPTPKPCKLYFLLCGLLHQSRHHRSRLRIRSWMQMSHSGQGLTLLDPDNAFHRGCHDICPTWSATPADCYIVPSRRQT